MAFDAGSILAKIKLDISQWEKSAGIVKNSQKKMTDQTKKTGKAFKGMWKQMAVGMGVTNLVTKSIREIGRQISDTIRTGRDFEREWANVTTMLNISRTATEKMRHELRMLSPTLGDTTELAKGMYQVLSASIGPAKAIRFLGEAAKSAKAGVTDTKTAVDAMTTVINAYGMEAEAAGEVSDIMFGIVKRGKVTYEELAHSLGTVVPIAATVGVNFRDVGAAVATLTRQGIQASKATMQLRQVMMLILGPSAEAMEVMDGLEMSYGKNALEAKGLAGWLEELKEKTKGNADIMRKIVPNARALTAALALVGKASKGYASDQEFLTEVMGFTDEAFKKQFESIDAWIEVAEVAADKIKIAFYEGLIASLRESIRTAEDFDEKVTKATNETASNISLYASIMGKAFGILGADVKRQLLPFQMFWDNIIEGKGATLGLAAAKIKLAEAIARSGHEIIITKEKTEELSDATDLLTRATRIYAIRLEELTEFEGVLDALTPPSELMVRWEEFYNLVETPELDLIWEQQMSSMEEDTLAFMASIIPGMAFMTEEIKEYFKSMGKSIKGTLGDAVSEAVGILSYLGRYFKAAAYAAAVINTAQAVTKALSFYPPPISFVMAALQAAAGAIEIRAISAQSIPTAEKGAYLPSPAIIEAGHGPRGEVILPLDRAPEGIGGPTMEFKFYGPLISTTGISERDIDEMTEYFFYKMRRESERYGVKLNA